MALRVADAGVSLQQPVLCPPGGRWWWGQSAKEEVNSHSWMNLELEDTVLSETRRPQKDKHAGRHCVRATEKSDQRKEVDWWVPGAGELVSDGAEFQFRKGMEWQGGWQ